MAQRIIPHGRNYFTSIFLLALLYSTGRSIHTEVASAVIAIDELYGQREENEQEDIPDICQQDTVPKMSSYCLGTCQNRCGEPPTPHNREDDIGQIQHHKCMCDEHCVLYNDCCDDFELKCPHIWNKTGSSDHNSVSCETYNVLMPSWTTPATGSFKMITNCENGTKCHYSGSIDYVRLTLEDLNLVVPATDTDTGLIYPSIMCALCNNVSGKDKLIPWTPTIDCFENDMSERHDYDQPSDDVHYATLKPQTKRTKRFSKRGKRSMTEPKGNHRVTITNMADFYTWMNGTTLCRTSFIPPNGTTTRQCLAKIDLKSECHPECTNDGLIQKCERGHDTYATDHVTNYRNIFCGLCNQKHKNLLKCGWYYDLNTLDSKFEDKPMLQVFSLSLMFSFDMTDGFRLATATPEVTTMSSKYEITKGENTSRNFNYNFNITILVHLTQDDAQDMRRILQYLSPDLILNATGLKLTEIYVMTDIVQDETNMRIGKHLLYVYMECEDICPKTALYDVMKLVSDFIHVIVPANKTFDDPLIIWTLNNRLNWSVVNTDNCLWTHLDLDIMGIDNTSLYTTNNTIHFRCDSPYPTIGHTKIHKSFLPSEYEGLLTIICLSVSIVSLILRILLQFCVKQYQTFSSKLQFNFAIALLLASVSTLVGPFIFIMKLDLACNLIGVFRYTMYIASFCWLNGIAFDAFRVVRSSTNLQSISDKHFSLIGFVCYGWGLPIICGAIILSLEYVDSSFKPRFNVHIQGSKTGACWFTNNLPLLIAFYIPITICTLFNLVCFLLVVKMLITMFNKTKNVLKQSDQYAQLLIFLKLFIILGLGWILALIAAFLQNSVLNMISVIVNSSQGFLFFLAYTCNRQNCTSLECRRTESFKHSDTTKTKTTRLSSNSKSENMKNVDYKFQFTSA